MDICPLTSVDICPLISVDISPRTSVDMRPAGGRELTVVSQDDDVDTSVEVDLLEAVHQLTHDPVHVLDGQNQLQDRNVEDIWTNPRARVSLPPGGSRRFFKLFRCVIISVTL